MRCFLINLINETERFKFMKRQLESMGIEFERFDAIDINTFSPEERKKLGDPSYRGNKLRIGEIGCALSHKAVYQKMIDEDINEALILEDDILFDTEKFRKLYDDLLKNRNWEYVSVNYDIFDKNFRESFFRNHKNTSYPRKFILILGMYLYLPIEWVQQSIGKLFGPILLVSPRPLHLSGAYFLKKSGAKKLLSISKTIHCPADYLQHQAQKMKGLHLHFVSPQIVHQFRDKFGSSTR